MRTFMQRCMAKTGNTNLSHARLHVKGFWPKPRLTWSLLEKKAKSQGQVFLMRRCMYLILSHTLSFLYVF